MGVEAVVCLSEWLGAAEMFWEDAGTGTTGCRWSGTKVS